MLNRSFLPHITVLPSLKPKGGLFTSAPRWVGQHIRVPRKDVPSLTPKKIPEKRVVIIDGSNLLHRYVHATGDLRNALSLFGILLLKSSTLHPPHEQCVTKKLTAGNREAAKLNKVVVTLDQVGPAPWRLGIHKKYKFEKKPRSKKHKRLIQQAQALAREMCQALKINVFPENGKKQAEGDDVIYTVRSRLGPKVHATVFSTDKDLFQVFALFPTSRNTALYRPGDREWFVNRSEVERAFNWPVDRLNECQALKGDPTDNLPRCSKEVRSGSPERYVMDKRFRDNVLLSTLHEEFPLFKNERFCPVPDFVRRARKSKTIDEKNFLRILMQHGARGKQDSIFRHLTYPCVSPAVLRKVKKLTDVDLVRYCHLLRTVRGATRRTHGAQNRTKDLRKKKSLEKNIPKTL